MKFFTPSFVVFLLFIFGGVLFKSLAPVTCGPILPDDSIFVLTGDERRIPFAMRLMKKYPDVDLYIIGVGGNASPDVTKKATIESFSRSTYQNALAIRKIVNDTGLDRIVIITTEDHMNRAKYLIHHEVPDIEIATCSARLIDMPATKRLERWGIEYIKYIATLFGIKEG